MRIVFVFKRHAVKELLFRNETRLKFIFCSFFTRKHHFELKKVKI